MQVVITGGSGFLGRALVSRLCRSGADRIATFSRDEQKRAALQREFAWHPGFRVYAGDVRDAGRLPDLFYGCEAVIHCAARKIVSGHPDEPEEMLKTNVCGTLNVVNAARAAGCRKLVFVSSDKAVRAENVYGKSKGLAEDLVVNANARTMHDGLRCGVVRYGNVIGSTGSVAVFWRQQAQRGLPLQITDPQMTRFWITAAQAVDLVLAALANLRGGEIVVPHLPAARITTLAEAIAGDGVTFRPVDDVPMERAANAARQGGEKVHEELLSATEVRRAVRRDDYYVIPPFQHSEMWDAKPWLGQPVDQALAYRSDVWPWQLTVADMRELLASCDSIAEARR